MNSFILSLKSTSDGLHGGLAFGKALSVSSSVCLLTWVMHVMYFDFGFILCLFVSVSLYGCTGGGEVGVIWSHCSGYAQDMMGWSFRRLDIHSASICSLYSMHMLF